MQEEEDEEDEEEEEESLFRVDAVGGGGGGGGRRRRKEEEEEEDLFRADAVNEEDPERDRARKRRNSKLMQGQHVAPFHAVSLAVYSLC